MALEAEKTWRRLVGFKLIPLVMTGRELVDGELTEAAAQAKGSRDDALAIHALSTTLDNIPREFGRHG